MKTQEWQPIETAPKDGQEALFYTKELGSVVLYWDDYHGQRWLSGFGSDGELTPTHWMPLPPPPIVSASKPPHSENTP